MSTLLPIVASRSRTADAERAAAADIDPGVNLGVRVREGRAEADVTIGGAGGRASSGRMSGAGRRRACRAQAERVRSSRRTSLRAGRSAARPAPAATAARAATTPSETSASRAMRRNRLAHFHRWPNRCHPNPLVTRLAPSPTGAQHLGNARTYLIAWLLRPASAAGASCCASRTSTRRASNPAPPSRRSTTCAGSASTGTTDRSCRPQRLALYEAALRTTASARTRLSLHLHPHPTSSRRPAPRTPRAPSRSTPAPVPIAARPMRRHSADRPFAWRFRVDRRAGVHRSAFAARSHSTCDEIGGDFVVWKSQGTPAYQLAVVVDDADNGVTEVVRGDDLVPSTPRQLLLYQALGLHAAAVRPRAAGGRPRRPAAGQASRRHAAQRAARRRRRGRTVVGLLAWSCGWLPEPTPVAVRRTGRSFRLDAIPPRRSSSRRALLEPIGYSRIVAHAAAASPACAPSANATCRASPSSMPTVGRQPRCRVSFVVSANVERWSPGRGGFRSITARHAGQHFQLADHIVTARPPRRRRRCTSRPASPRPRARSPSTQSAM